MPDETGNSVQKDAVPRKSFIKAQLVFTLLLGVLPYIPYANGRLFHGLPSEAQWQSRGANHGPWWSVFPLQELIIIPMLILAGLPFLTILLFMLTGLSRNDFVYLWQSIGLIALQWGLFVLQLGTVFWVID